MKRTLMNSWFALVTVLLFWSMTVQAQVYVSQWGKTSRGKAWPINNTATTPAGEASIGSGAKPTDWATIRGGFDPVEATTDQAVIVSGQMILNGGCGSSYTHLRYALTFQDSVELKYQYTDSAVWVSSKPHYGYQFTPRTGMGTMANGNGGSGTVWTVNGGGGWNSTWSNNGLPIASVKQAPNNAEMIAGTYNWAISVQPLANGNIEVRWYMVEQNNKYWFGGTVIDTFKVSKKFNGICFGFNKDDDFKSTLVLFKNVKVEFGQPINVPVAPWEPYYLTKWGNVAGRWGKWRVEPGEFDGDVSMFGPKHPDGSWATVRGAFDDPVTATFDKAVIVKGKLEIVGDDINSWSPLRFGIFRHDSIGTLWKDTNKVYVYEDGSKDTNMAWNGKENYAYGYLFMPRSGTNTSASWSNGGNGEAGAIVGGTWLSTWGGARVIGRVNPKPARAIISKGVYNFAISVHRLDDKRNEVRVYFYKQGTPVKYWFGGSFIDTNAVTTTFNGFCLGLNNGNGIENFKVTGLNLTEVQVDWGAPITVPEAPWEPYYVTEWGNVGPRWGKWRVEPGEFDGDVVMFGEKHPDGSWATVRGAFIEPVSATTQKAVIVKGKLEIVGDDINSWSPLRFGIFRHDSIGTLWKDTNKVYVYPDGSKDTNMAWNGKENYAYGYLFMPRSGTNTSASWSNGGNGEAGAIVGGTWLSTWGGARVIGRVNPKPARAIISKGVYNFAISVHRLDDKRNEVRVYFYKQGTPVKYWFGGSFIDTNAVTTTFNGFCLGLNNGNGIENFKVTGLNLTEVQVDWGTPITVPEAPWEPYYVTDWGISGRQAGGWKLDLGEFDGDAVVGGASAPTGLVAVRGGFVEPHEPKETKALIVKGKLKLTGGGFPNLGSFRFGIFYSDSAGTTWQDSTLDSSWTWKGTDRAHSGYLIVSPSGSNMTSWATGNGTIGGILNGKWWDPSANSWALGAPMPDPASSAPGAGEYDFAISVRPLADGKNEIKFFLRKKDGTYYFAGTALDNHAPVATNKYNCVAFALNNVTATKLELMEITVDMGAPIVGIADPETKPVPKEFALLQNYPNPFNPSTNIAFALPQAADVSLVVYNLMGQKVAELVNRKMEPGYYNINFDASNLASGIYIYRLKAGNFVSTKKLMLVK